MTPRKCISSRLHIVSCLYIIITAVSIEKHFPWEMTGAGPVKSYHGSRKLFCAKTVVSRPNLQLNFLKKGTDTISFRSVAMQRDESGSNNPTIPIYIYHLFIC